MFYIHVFSVDMTKSPYDPNHEWYFEWVNKNIAKYEDKLYKILIEQNTILKPEEKLVYKYVKLPLIMYACKNGYVNIKFDELAYEDGTKYENAVKFRMDMEYAFKELNLNYPSLVKSYDKMVEEENSKQNLELRKQERISKMIEVLTFGNDLRKKPLNFETLKTYTSIPYERIVTYEYEKLEKRMPEFLKTYKELYPEIYKEFKNDTAEIFKFFNKETEKSDLLIKDMDFFDYVKRNEKRYFDYQELTDKILYEETTEPFTRKERLEICYNAYELQSLTKLGKLEIDYNKLTNLDVITLKLEIEKACKEAIKLYPQEFKEIKDDIQLSREKSNKEFLLKIEKEHNTKEKEAVLNFARQQSVEIEDSTKLALYEKVPYPYIINYEYEKLEKEYFYIIENWKNKTLEK